MQRMQETVEALGQRVPGGSVCLTGSSKRKRPLPRGTGWQQEKRNRNRGSVWE